MLRRLRHKLRMMRYYSAPRRETVWTRAEDWALLIALLLSLPAAWVANHVAVDPRQALKVTGLLLGEREVQLRGWIVTADNMRREPPGRVFARWSLEVTDEHRGWPLTTSVHRRPAALELDVVHEPKPRKNAVLAPDSPMRLAMAAALQVDGLSEVLDAWELNSPAARQNWWAWLAAWAAWWISLTLASWFGIRVIKIIALKFQRSRKLREFNRRAEGKCVACGYDLTGLDFRDRCPECGTLMW